MFCAGAMVAGNLASELWKRAEKDGMAMPMLFGDVWGEVGGELTATYAVSMAAMESDMVCDTHKGREREVSQ